VCLCYTNCISLAVIITIIDFIFCHKLLYLLWVRRFVDWHYIFQCSNRGVCLHSQQVVIRDRDDGSLIGRATEHNLWE
jgi:hypothetical protein